MKDYRQSIKEIDSENYLYAISILEDLLYKYKLNKKNKNKLIEQIKKAAIGQGTIYQNQGSYDKAARIYEKYESISEEGLVNDNYFKLKFLKAKCFFLQNFFDDAINVFMDLKNNKYYGHKDNSISMIASCYYKQGKYDDLIYFVENESKNMKDGPEKYYLLLLNAISLFKTGKNQDSLNVLTKILKSKYADENTITAAMGWLKQVKKEIENSNMIGSNSTNHFNISFEKNDNMQLLDDISDIAENAYSDIGRIFNCYPDNKITILIYTPTNFFASSAVAMWAGACYDAGRLKLPICYLKGDQTKENIYHEYTHFIVELKSKSANIPLWFNEGCAVNASNGINNTYTKIMKNISKTNKTIPLDTLSLYFRSSNPNTALIGYSYSAYLVKYIIEEKGERALEEILEWTAEGETFKSAFYNVFFKPLKKFNEDFLSWIKSHI